MSCRSARARESSADAIRKTLVIWREVRKLARLVNTSLEDQAHRIDLGVTREREKKRSRVFGVFELPQHVPRPPPERSALARSTLTVFRPTSELSRRAKASSASPNPPEVSSTQSFAPPVARPICASAHSRGGASTASAASPPALGGRAAPPSARPQTPQERLLAFAERGIRPVRHRAFGNVPVPVPVPVPSPGAPRARRAKPRASRVFSFFPRRRPWLRNARDPPPRARLPAPPRARPRGART